MFTFRRMQVNVILLYNENTEKRIDEIIAAGLDIPMITKVMLELKKRGHDVDTSVYTVAQAMDALRACKRKEAAHEC